MTAAASRAPALPDRPAPTLDSLAVTVARTANRAVSYTNRRSAFYYTQTHVNDHPEHAWLRGLSIAGRRVFSDYRLTVAGFVLDPSLASKVVVRPDELLRTYPSGITETLRLYDDRDVVGVEVTGAHGDAAVTLAGDMVQADGEDGDDRYYAVGGRHLWRTRDGSGGATLRPPVPGLRRGDVRRTSFEPAQAVSS